MLFHFPFREKNRAWVGLSVVENPGMSPDYRSNGTDGSHWENTWCEPPRHYKRVGYSYLIHAWWRHQIETFPRHWPFVRGIHRSPMDSPHKGQWSRAEIFPLIPARISGRANSRSAGDFRRHRIYYGVIVMIYKPFRVSAFSRFKYLIYYYGISIFPNYTDEGGVSA